MHFYWLAINPSPSYQHEHACTLRLTNDKRKPTTSWPVLEGERVWEANSYHQDEGTRDLWEKWMRCSFVTRLQDFYASLFKLGLQKLYFQLQQPQPFWSGKRCSGRSNNRTSFASHPQGTLTRVKGPKMPGPPDLETTLMNLAGKATDRTISSDSKNCQLQTFKGTFGLWNLRIMDFLLSWLPFFNAPRKNWCLGFFFIENRRWPWPEDPLRAISLQLHKGRSLGKGVALKGATKKHVHMPSFGSCSWDEKAWNFQPLLGF